MPDKDLPSDSKRSSGSQASVLFLQLLCSIRTPSWHGSSKAESVEVAECPPASRNPPLPAGFDHREVRAAETLLNGLCGLCFWFGISGLDPLPVLDCLV